MKKTFVSLLMALLCFAFASCGGDSGPSSEPVSPTPAPAKVPVTGVSLSQSSISLKEGVSVEVTVTVMPDNASNKNVSWKSEDTGVATVSSGKITAVAPGVTDITVTSADGNKTATLKVTVTMDVPYRQKKALLALFEKTGGASWKNKDGWNTDTPYKQWYGVKVSNDYVTEIDLSDNNLTGQLPDGLQNLSKLTKLVLANNQLSGAIPASLGELESAATTKAEATTRDEKMVPKLASLKTLDLSGNQFTGTIPEALGNLTELTTLKLANNKLTGNLPTTLANLSKLTTLTIAHNELEGELPKEIKDSKMWEKVGAKTDLTQDNGKVIDSGKPVDPAPDPEPTPTPEPEPTPTPPAAVNVTSIALTRASMTIEVNEVVQLTATVKPDEATSKAVTWATSNSAIATVASDGKVTAKAAGITNITATANDGSGVKGTCIVTVVAATTSTTTTESVTNNGNGW